MMLETNYFKNLALPAEKIKRLTNSLSELEAETILHDWPLWAREKQLPPEGHWHYWLILAGRGFGKTRTGAEWVREQIKTLPYVNIIGATSDDARDVMIEGESGLLSICPKDERPKYVPHKARLEWPNGAMTLIFTAEKPDRLRGKQHMAIWADELAAWRYPDAWHQAKLGLRLGENPRALITTTPRPVAEIKQLIEDEHCHVTYGTTYENRSHLAPAFFDAIIKQYEGTRLGRQELEAELLTDVPGALWHYDLFIRANNPKLIRIVIGVDPAVTNTEDSDETGIIVCGIDQDRHGYVLADHSLKGSPKTWASKVVELYHQYHADRVVVEVNNGGDMIEHTIRTIDPMVAIQPVRASRSKLTRAEPVAALYEQGKVHHVGTFAKLEDQLCEWMPGSQSPDRLDALVWALTALLLKEKSVNYYGLVRMA